MRNLQLAFRSLFKKGHNNLIKILSLSVGLAMGLVLLSKVYFEQTYDDFYPDAERIYSVMNTISIGGDELGSSSSIFGGVAPGMKAEIPSIEAATRYTRISYKSSILTGDKKRYSFDLAVLGDSSLFDVLSRPVLAGNAKEVLSRPMQAMISHSLAEKIGGPEEVMNKSFTFDGYPGTELIIAGIFEDIPDNSHIRYDIVVSMPSIGSFMYDNSEDWVGSDKYMGYIKLQKGIDIKSLYPQVEALQDKYQREAMEQAGANIKYYFEPITSLHSGTPEVKRMTLLLSILAFAVIFTAMMNYVLIVISSLVKRSREVAIEKCYGASNSNISGNMFTETFVYLLASLVVAALLIFVSKGLIGELLGASLHNLFTFRSGIFLLGVAIVIFFATALIPSRIYSSIPVSTAIKGYSDTKRSWKKALLLFQLVAAAFLLSLLLVINLQYNKMVNDDPGYKYERLLYTYLHGVSQSDRQTIINELKKEAEIESLATVSTLPFSSSGNNLMSSDGNEILFNYSDFEWVNEGYTDIMEIPIIEGNGFDKNSTQGMVLISQLFAEKLLTHYMWPDGVIGKHINTNTMGEVSIVGVYPDIRIGTGGIGAWINRPSIMFYSPDICSTLVIKMNNITPENILKIDQLISNIIPDKDVNVLSYKNEMINLYQDSRVFRDSVMIGGLVTLVITLIGLIGYLGDETTRRRKEVAIRRVNGAKIKEVQQLFVTDILKITIPALIVGCVASAFAATKWMEGFVSRINLSVFIFLASSLLVLAIVLAIVLINTYRAAIQNPAKTIKAE